MILVGLIGLVTKVLVLVCTVVRCAGTLLLLVTAISMTGVPVCPCVWLIVVVISLSLGKELGVATIIVGIRVLIALVSLLGLEN